MVFVAVPQGITFVFCFNLVINSRIVVCTCAANTNGCYCGATLASVIFFTRTQEHQSEK
jgi:hypothetical protein